MPGELLRALDDLLDAAGVSTLDELSDHLYAALDLDLDPSYHVDGETFFVVLGNVGTGFEFPITLQEFYDGVADLEDEAVTFEERSDGSPPPT